MHKRQEIDEKGRLAYKAFEQLLAQNVPFTPEALTDKLKALERGLPAEDEFVALVSWLGKCKLIHKLEQEQYPKSSKDLYQVPDFFAVFEYRGRNLPVLIEVKRTEKETLKWSSKYFDKLKRYADLLNLPLLIACMFRLEELNWNYWTLFDARAFIKPHKSYKMTLEIASSKSIMGQLAGDFFIDIKAGVGFHFQMELSGSEEECQKMRETGTLWGRMHSFWTDGNGNEIDAIQQIPELLSILNCGPSIGKSSYHDTGAAIITQSYTLPDNYLLHAHRILPILLTEALTEEAWNFQDSEFTWSKVLRKDKFPISASQIINVVEKAPCSNIINYIIYQVPETMPEFLK